MIQSVLAHQFEGLLFVMGACLLFIIVTPKFLFEKDLRKLLFDLILILMTFFYFAFEDIDPFIYAMHLTPISIALAVLFEGGIPGASTWLAFILGGTVLLGNDPVATLCASSVVLIGGMAFRLKGVRMETMSQIVPLSLILVSGHMACYYAVDLARGGTPQSPVTLSAIVLGTLLSSWFVCLVYFNVKNQEKWREEVFNAEKYQMIGQLAASISHEIRNPLTTTRGFLQLMGRKDLDRATFERYRTFAFQGIDNANAIITDYLNYAKPTVEEARPLNVKGEIESIIPWLQSLSVTSKIELRITHLSSESLWILGESQKFQQCLLNVTKNAIESMPDGGKLTVQTRLYGDTITIQVRDTGAGMTDDQIKRIGLPFYTTKEKGTGLGLMVVISLVRAMNGRIVYRSKPGQGTVCELQFKAASPPEGEPEAKDLAEQSRTAP